MSQSELQRRLERRGGIRTQGAVSRWINGARIEPPNARLLADDLGYDRAFVLYLAGYGDEPVPDLDQYTMSQADMDAAVASTVAAATAYQQRVDDDESRSIPSIGRIGAGPGNDNDHIVVWRPKWLKRFPKNLRAAEVVGDCLTPDVLPGDLAVIDLDGSWGPNKVIAVRSGDGAQLKRFVRHEPGENDEPGRLVLTSNDGEFSLSDNDADIIGVFLFAQRTIRVT
jgi:SOS-response transcriptional repressor LexA